MNKLLLLVALSFIFASVIIAQDLGREEGLS